MGTFGQTPPDLKPWPGQHAAKCLLILFCYRDSEFSRSERDLNVLIASLSPSGSKLAPSKVREKFFNVLRLSVKRDFHTF